MNLEIYSCKYTCILQNLRQSLRLSHSKYEKGHVHTINNLSVKDEKPFESVNRTSHICRLNVNPGYGKILFKNMNEIW